MATRIWLNAKGTSKLEPKQAGSADLLKIGDALLRVDTENGIKYVNLTGDLVDPSAVFQAVPREFVRTISYADKYFEGFRTDGIYRHKGAVARVETIESAEGYGETRFDRRYQNISISAGSIKTLREIYTQVRQGKLKPTEDWGVHSTELAQRERQAAQEAAEGEASQTEH